MQKEIVTEIVKGLEKTHSQHQKRPNQYVVVYKRRSDDSILGYHQSTFCQVTPDILRGKRYAGEPYEQLTVIWSNVCKVLAKTEKDCSDPFGKLAYRVKMEHFQNLNPEDIYIDAVYLVDGMPEQEFTVGIINP